VEKPTFFRPIILVLFLAPSASTFGTPSNADTGSVERMASEIVTSDLFDASVTEHRFMRPMERNAVPLIDIDKPPDDLADAIAVQRADTVITPLQIGQGIDVPNPDIDSAQIRWQLMDNTWVGHFDIRAGGAETLRAALRIGERATGTRLPADMHDKIALRYGGSDQKVFEVTLKKIMESDDYWSMLIPGDVIHVEVLMPSTIHPEAITVRIPHLSYFPKSRRKRYYSDGFYSAGNCQRDVACRPESRALHQASDAVAKMIYTERNGYSYTCTGTLLNNRHRPKRALFLTAKHCISTQSAARSLITVWHYQTTQCGGSPATVDRRVTQRQRGATLLSAHPVFDIALLELNDSPPAGAHYQGWSTQRIERGDAVQGIHHPRGDAKKHSMGTISYAGRWRGNDTSSTGVEVSWGASHDAGVTEGGSSGSGIFTHDDNGALVLRGTLVGGSSSCRNALGWRTDQYEPFSEFFPSVRHYF
jgi:V8-like Glu-specific endopeptidase